MGNSSTYSSQVYRDNITIEQYNDGWIKSKTKHRDRNVFYFGDPNWDIPECDISFRKLRITKLQKCITELGDVLPGERLEVIRYIKCSS